MHYLTRLCFLVLILALAPIACADSNTETKTKAEETSSAAKDEATASDATSEVDQFLEKLAGKVPSMKVDYTAKAPMPGFYEVLTDGQLIYITEDANFLFSGRLFGLQNGIVDLSRMAKERADLMRAPSRKAKLDKVPQDEMITFKADNEQYRITVFTDVDCGWCRKLHREIENYNDLGITIQYLAFPRAGMGSSSYVKLRSVWCSDDKVAAMDLAKIKQEFSSNTCDDPIESHLKLVRDFGISGTPAIVFESGLLVQSFLAPDDMLTYVKKDKKVIEAAESETQGSASD